LLLFLSICIQSSIADVFDICQCMMSSHSWHVNHLPLQCLTIVLT